MASKVMIAAVVVIAAAAAISAALYAGGIGPLISFLLNPPGGLPLAYILLIALVLGVLHGITPDEHTWPITFSYAVGSYSTRRGMKAGFVFSSGFTIQRALLTTLGFIGLAAFYKAYNLDGPVYIIVGIAMAVAGAYVLNKMRDLHIPFDLLLGGRSHHSSRMGAMHVHERERDVPSKMAFAHGLIAGFGFGAYASIITFVLAPQVPGVLYAPLVGAAFGIGTMLMQIALGAAFANLARMRRMGEKDVAEIGRKTAGRTLYYGGAAFAVIGAAIILFPFIGGLAVGTGVQIPDLDSIGVSSLLVLFVVGVIGFGSLAFAIRDAMRRSRRAARTRNSGGRRPPGKRKPPG